MRLRLHAGAVRGRPGCWRKVTESRNSCGRWMIDLFPCDSSRDLHSQQRQHVTSTLSHATQSVHIRQLTFIKARDERRVTATTSPAFHRHAHPFHTSSFFPELSLIFDHSFRGVRPERSRANGGEGEFVIPAVHCHPPNICPIISLYDPLLLLLLSLLSFSFPLFICRHGIC